MIELLKAAQERVNGSVLFKRFIEHTPLENDVAVWMAEFTQERIAELEAELTGLRARRRSETWRPTYPPCPGEEQTS